MSNLWQARLRESLGQHTHAARVGSAVLKSPTGASVPAAASLMPEPTQDGLVLQHCWPSGHAFEVLEALA